MRSFHVESNLDNARANGRKKERTNEWMNTVTRLCDGLLYLSVTKCLGRTYG